MFRVRQTDNGVVLERKRSRWVEVCRIIDGEKRLLIIDKHKKRYIFKQKDKPLKFEHVGQSAYTVITGMVDVFIKPHHSEFHNVLMTENRNRYSLARAAHRQNLDCDYLLDEQGILNNLLEFVAKI